MLSVQLNFNSCGLGPIRFPCQSASEPQGIPAKINQRKRHRLLRQPSESDCKHFIYDLYVGTRFVLTIYEHLLCIKIHRRRNR